MGDDLWMARYLLHRVAEVHLGHGDSLDRNDLTKMLNQIEQLLKMGPRIFWPNGLHRVAGVHLEHGDSLNQDNMTNMLYQIEPAENVTLDFWQNGFKEAQRDSPHLSTKL